VSTECCTNDATTLSRVNVPGYIGDVTTFSYMLSIAYCLLVYRVRFWLIFSVWFVSVMHTYLYYFPFSLHGTHSVRTAAKSRH